LDRGLDRGANDARILGVVTEQLMNRARRSDEAIVAGNRAGVIEWVNPAWSRLTGCAADDTVHKPISQLLHKWEIDRSVLDFVQLNFLAGRRSAVEFPITNLDGRSLWIHLEVESQRDATGDVAEFVAFVSDITDRREAELALERHLDLTRPDESPPLEVRPSQQAEPPSTSALRLEALGLQAIESCHALEPMAARISRLCTDRVAPTALEIAEVAALADGLRSEADAVLRRASQQRQSSRDVDVSDIAHCCCMAIAKSVPDTLLIDARLPTGLPAAQCNAAELAGLATELMQLGVTSVDDAWGTLSITTGTTTPGVPLESDVYHTRFAGTLYDERPRLFIEIHDSGDALDGDQLARLGEDALPAPPPGRILSLLAAQARARAIGGELHVNSAPGCGTRLLLLLPASGSR
jgi:PAS domain S-box-containing protein